MQSDEISKVLPDDLDPTKVIDHLKIHASPAGTLGETFVIRYGAKWLGLYRESMLDGFTLVTLDANDPTCMKRSAFGAKLTLNVMGGEPLEIEVSTLDQDRVEVYFGVEEELDTVREAGERLSAPPGSLKVGDAPDEKPLSLDPPAEEPTVDDRPEGVAAGSDEDVEEDDDGTPEPELGDEELDERLIELLGAGRKAAAMRLYRKARGGSRQDAQEFLEDLQEDLLVGAESERELDSPSGQRRELEEDDLGIPPLLEGELVGYLKMGHVAEAVRRYRIDRNAGMVDAQEAIERVASRYDIKVSDGSAFWWRLFFILILAAVVIAYLRFVYVPS